MHRLIRSYSVALLSAAFCLSSSAQIATNPILPHADPFITPQPVNGKFLLLATTGHNITIWNGTTVETSARDSKVVFVPRNNLEQLWSPTLWKIAGKWWIYFTAMEPGKQHAIYVLESDTSDPLGAYTFRGQPRLAIPQSTPR